MDVTKTTAWQQAYDVAVLKEEVCEVEELRLRYRLCGCYFAEPRYYVEICLGEERSAAYLGEDLSKARRAFEMIAEHTVTPCTLADIIQDAKKTCVSPLQI